MDSIPQKIPDQSKRYWLETISNYTEMHLAQTFDTIEDAKEYEIPYFWKRAHIYDNVTTNLVSQRDSDSGWGWIDLNG